MSEPLTLALIFDSKVGRYLASVGQSVMIKSKSVKTCIYDASVMIVCEHGIGEGVDGGCMP